MYKYYIPHKLSIGDITHLADNDSKIAISNGVKEEQLIEVSSPNGIFLAQITFIERNSVEVEILKKVSDIEQVSTDITIIQGVSGSSKFGLFLEKITEIGVDRVIPMVSSLSLLDMKKAKKEVGLWNKIVRDATEQSRNPNPPIISNIVDIKQLNTVVDNESVKLCFATEDVKSFEISQLDVQKNKKICLAFGPESGWSAEDINIFKKSGFIFVRLKGNILRTETTPIVATSIIKFILKQL